MPKISAEKNDVASRLLDVVRQFVLESGGGVVTWDSSFERDLGLDSLARVELLQRVGKVFNIQLPPAALLEAGTSRELLRFLIPGKQASGKSLAVALPGAQAVVLPEQANTLPDVIEWHAMRVPHRVHVIIIDDMGGEHAVCHRDLFAAARETAAGLLTRGLPPSGTVALMLPTGLDYLVCFLGVMMAGGIPVPIYPPARLEQLEDHLNRHTRILLNAQTTMFVTVAQAAPIARRLQSAVPCLTGIVQPHELRATSGFTPRILQASDTAFLQYTSGSTGYPKGVVLTHANLLANIRALGKASRTSASDVFVSWLPLYHDMGLIGAWLGSLYHGVPLVLMSPSTFLARPASWLETISRHHGTLSAAPNFAYQLCLKYVSDDVMSTLDLSSWRLAMNGAEPVNAGTLEAFAAKFGKCGLSGDALAPVYGLAESSVGLTFPPPGRPPRIEHIARKAFDEVGLVDLVADSTEDSLAIPSCGNVLTGHEVRIVDATGNELPERHIGRLEFRGPSATAGYFRNPEATRQLFHGSWLDSGDYAFVLDGEVFIAGRVKDLIKHGGRNLYPYELEEAIGKISGIRAGCVAVFPSVNRVDGLERIIAMAETRSMKESQLASLRTAIDQAAIDIIGVRPDDTILVGPHTVPKTSSGKLRRVACREMYEHGTWRKRPLPGRLQAAQFLLRSGLASASVSARRLADRAYGCCAWLVFILLAGIVVPLIMAQSHVERCRRIARVGARLFFRFTLFGLSAEGLEHLPSRPHVLLLNHSSYLDVIALIALLPARYAFAAKRELSTNPLLRLLLERLHCVWIERFDLAQLDTDVDAMTNALLRGENLIVFPEGGFTRETGLRTFHLGGLIAASRAGALIVPGGLRGTRLALRDETWLPRRTSIELHIGEAKQMEIADWRKSVAARDDMRAVIGKLCGEHLIAG